MRHGLLAFEVVALAFALGPGCAQVARAEEMPQYSASQIREMARAARTPEQYTQLADYYQARRRMYVKKAAEEMDLVIQRNAVFTPLSEKWPRPVDSARNLYEFYLYQAAKSAATATRYAERANEAAAR